MTTVPSSIRPPPRRPQRILIVEDEPDIARGLRDALEFEGFDVDRRSAPAARASTIVRERTPDLVILDLMLPDVNGFLVCEQIRQQPPDACRSSC